MQQLDLLDKRAVSEFDDQTHWLWRLALRILDRFRPDGGWLVLITCLVLAALPAMALGENRIADLRRIQVGLDLVGPLAVLATWFWLGWRRLSPSTKRPWLRGCWQALAILLTGVVILSEVLVGWIPAVGEVWNAALTNQWAALGQAMLNDWAVMTTRFALWWSAVRSGGAGQDNLIFAAVAGCAFWLVAVIMAWCVRVTRRGFLSAAVPLWLLGSLLLYTSTGRTLMLSGLLLTVTLHLLLEHESLIDRWQRLGLDFSPGLIADRLIAVFGIVAAVTVIASVVPNLYFEPLVWGYYRLIEPVESRFEDLRERLFPQLRGTSRRIGGGGGLDGLPNEFLLGGNVQLGESVVMYVRTSDSAGYEEYLYSGAPFDLPSPPSHYMRGVTLTQYDGRGWSNPANLTRVEYGANERWPGTEELPGRKQLVQTISLLVNSSVLYGAAEQMESGVNYAAELRNEGDLVALRARASNYTVVSSIPAVSTEQLSALPAWGAEQPLPDGYEIHLELPDTITERTRELMSELTDGVESPFLKAQAIERYLRQYEYDLDVNEPPGNVDDLADYFLFDLRRGYCDYYTTAFIVLARLAGLPARFASGYASGAWDPVDGTWIITEAEAHSWPEVFFPTYGWIAFEPTAGRPELSRVGLPEFTTGAPLPAVPAPPAATIESVPWTWQMLVWLLPIGALIWGGWMLFQRWRRRREDPWLGVVRWGQRAGRPLGEGETVLEYGRGLAHFILDRPTDAVDANRIAAREVTVLSDLVTQLRYAPNERRAGLLARMAEHWTRLRDYLPYVRKR